VERGELVLLVERARRRDAEAFGQLVRRYERTALAVAYAQLGDGNRAADAVQDGCLKAWQKLDTLCDPARFVAWWCGIVRNVAIDHRRRPREAGWEAVPGDARAARNPAEEIGAAETRDQITAALDGLDDVTRTAVVLRYYEGLSSRQIGDLLALSPSAVDMRLSRARQELRVRLAGAVSGEHIR